MNAKWKTEKWMIGSALILVLALTGCSQANEPEASAEDASTKQETTGGETKEVAAQADDDTQDSADKVEETARQVADDAGEAASQFADEAQETMTEVSSALEKAFMGNAKPVNAPEPEQP